MVKSSKSTPSKSSRLVSKKKPSTSISSQGIDSGPRRLLRSNAGITSSVPRPDSPSLLRTGPDPSSNISDPLDPQQDNNPFENEPPTDDVDDPLSDSDLKHPDDVNDPPDKGNENVLFQGVINKNTEKKLISSLNLLRMV